MMFADDAKFHKYVLNLLMFNHVLQRALNHAQNTDLRNHTKMAARSTPKIRKTWT